MEPTTFEGFEGVAGVAGVEVAVGTRRVLLCEAIE